MIYFDNAATTLKKPESVVNAVTEALCNFGNSGRSVHEGALSASRVVYEARVALAEFFGSHNPERIVFTANATEALNIAIKGILDKGDHVITTALEHNSVLRPLYEMEEKGVELTILAADSMGKLNYLDIETAIRKNTKAIICTHASNLTGNILDVKQIGAIAKKHGILFVLDASQTAGVWNINVNKFNIDILCFTGHKGLLGPQGTGGLYVKDNINVRPLLSGGSGVQTYLKNHPQQMPTALEAGTLNAHGIAGLLAGVRYIEEVKIENIREKELSLMWYFYDQIKDIEGITVYGDFSTPNRCPIVAINVRNYESGVVSDILSYEHNIATRPGAHCAPLMHHALGTVEQGCVRFSFSHYNTKEEINFAVNVLRELAQEV